MSQGDGGSRKVRPPSRPPRSADVHEGGQDLVGEGDFDRRRFLRRDTVAGGIAWATPVVTTLGLSRATATPCAGVSEASSTALKDDPFTSAQEASRTERTHTDCYKTCMEQRATREAQAQEEFLACAAAAGDETALAECAKQYRRRVREYTNAFLSCQGACR